MTTASREIARVLNTYLYPVILLIIYLGTLFILSTFTQESIPVYPKDTTWDSAQKPEWFLHMSDIHLSTLEDKRPKRLLGWFSAAKNQIFPTAVINTGDTADNYIAKTVPSDSYQMENLWQMYKTQVTKSGFVPSENGKLKLIEVPGNHDVYNVFKDTPDVFWRKYYHNIGPNTFANSYEVGDTRFVTFLPADFPTSHGPQLYVPPVTSKMVDQLENELKKPTNAKNIILCNHFASELMYPLEKGKSGSDYFDLLKKYNVNILLTGHTHPKTFEILHHGETVEFTSVAMKEKDEIGLLTIDNGRIHYNSRNLSSKMAVITSPAPSSQAGHIFKDKKFDVRVLAFFDDATTGFEVTGDVTGTLDRQTPGIVADKVFLYSKSFTFTNGKHKIRVKGGDLDEEIEFHVGVEAGPYTEPRKVDFNKWAPTANVVIAVLYNCFVIAGLFIQTNAFKKCQNWLLGKSEESHWLLAVLCGPVMLGSRLRRLPYKLWLYVIFLGLWPLVFPTVIYYTDGKLSCVWFYGYIIDGKNRLDVMSQILIFTYWVFITTMLYDWLSFLIIQMSWSLVADFILNLFFFCASFAIWYIYGADISVNYLWMSSFGNFLLPLVTVLGVMTLWIIQRARGGPSVGSSDTSSGAIHDEIEVV